MYKVLDKLKKGFSSPIWYQKTQKSSIVGFSCHIFPFNQNKNSVCSCLPTCVSPYMIFELKHHGFIQFNRSKLTNLNIVTFPFFKIKDGILDVLSSHKTGFLPEAKCVEFSLSIFPHPFPCIEAVFPQFPL